jgi:hypothetical protein
MNISYLLYQAERVRSPREQLEADVHAGERAKAVARLWHSLLPARHRPPGYQACAGEVIERSCVTAGRWS